MDKQINHLYVPLRIAGAAFLAAAILQVAAAVPILAMDYAKLPAFLKSDALLLTLLSLPAILLFVYIILRLYTEMHCVWRTALAAVGYVPLAFFWSYISFLFDGGRLSMILFCAMAGFAIFVPIVLTIFGLWQKKRWMTLVSFMIFNANYISFAFFAYGMGNGDTDMGMAVGVGFILPLLLLVLADLMLLNRLAARSDVNDKVSAD